jgi:hypothetical protein
VIDVDERRWRQAVPNADLQKVEQEVLLSRSRLLRRERLPLPEIPFGTEQEVRRPSTLGAYLDVVQEGIGVAELGHLWERL